MTIYYIAAVLAAAAAFIIPLVVGRKHKKALSIVLKTVSLVLAAIFTARYFIGREYIHLNIDTLLKSVEGFASNGWIVLALFQVWFAIAAELLIALFPFFKFKPLNHLVGLFGLTAFVLNFSFMANHITAIEGPAALTDITLRGVFVAVETGLGLGYCAYVLMHCVKDFKLTGKQWGQFALAVLGIIVCCTPAYAPQVLIGKNYLPVLIEELNLYHRLYIYPAFIIPIVLYLILKNRSHAAKKFALLYYALAILVMFTLKKKLPDFDNVTALPLHLCNTALYITPLCLIFKWRKVFYFTYFINVLGAFLALTIPDNGDVTFFDPSTVMFFREHYQAFFMPLLIVGLGIYDRPRLREFRYSMIGFAVYFLCILIINAWFTNYDANVDYFFLNSDFVADKLGVWAERLRDFVWEFDLGSLHFKFYPVYQALYFAVYFAVAVGMWFLYELGYETVKSWQDIAVRRRKVKADRLALECSLAGRSTEEPMYPEENHKLILKYFTKRYGHSDVFAVKNADLEVCGGEIFGFLGPNGAGKSTIIKSIVGIQPITEGAITVCGYDVEKQSVAAKREIGYVPDHYALYEKLTAREYINYIADLYDVTKEERDERLNRFIGLFEFETAIDNQMKTYSHGMKQKVTIMAALIHNPKLWILDEPLTGLDPSSIFQVKECMKQHAADGNIVFFSSHIIDVVERICDRIAIIRKGQIQCVKTVAEIESNGVNLEKFYMDVINAPIEPIKVSNEQVTV